MSVLKKDITVVEDSQIEDSQMEDSQMEDSQMEDSQIEDLNDERDLYSSKNVETIILQDSEVSPPSSLSGEFHIVILLLVFYIAFFWLLSVNKR